MTEKELVLKRNLLLKKAATVTSAKALGTVIESVLKITPGDPMFSAFMNKLMVKFNITPDDNDYLDAVDVLTSYFIKLDGKVMRVIGGNINGRYTEDLEENYRQLAIRCVLAFKKFMRLPKSTFDSLCKSTGIVNSLRNTKSITTILKTC